LRPRIKLEEAKAHIETAQVRLERARNLCTSPGSGARCDSASVIGREPAASAAAWTPASREVVWIACDGVATLARRVDDDDRQADD
jgi:hypothetical protein